MTEIRTRAATVDDIDASRENDVSLSTALRRRIVLIVGVTALLGLLAGGFGYLRPTSYTATARVQLHPLAGNPLNDNALFNSQEIAVAMNSEAVTVDSAPVVANTGIAAGSSNVTVAVVLNTTTLTIAYSAKTASEAVKGANELGLAFLKYRNTVATGSDTAAATKLQNLLGDEVRRLQTLKAATKGAEATPSEAADIAQLTGQILEYQKAIAKTDAAIPSSTPKLAVPATSATTSGTKLKLLLPVAAALVGFLLTAGYAVYRARNERAIRGADHVAIAGRPVLATLTGRQRGSGVTENDNAALRRARLGLLAATGPHSVVALSPVGANGDANREIARRIGRSLSNAGYRVALVDCRQADTRRERRERAKRKTRAAMLAQPAGPTLDELFDDGWTPDTALARVGPLDVVHAARRPLGTDQVRLRDLLHVMARDYDFVIVEADPLDTPTGLAAAFAGDQLVLTAIERTTLRVDIERVIERAERIGASVVGVVVSAPSRKLRADAAQAAEGRRPGGSTERTDGVGKAAGWVPDAQ